MKVAIISGKGGSGKSSVSAALIACAERVVAVDCDVDASNLPMLFSCEKQAEESFASGVSLEVDAKKCVGCGLCAQHCAFGALEMGEQGVVEAFDLKCEGCGLCERLCGQHAIVLRAVEASRIDTSRFEHGVMVHGDLNPGDDNSGKMIARMREVADQMMSKEGIDLQILDGPPGIGCSVLSTVTGVDRVVIVAEPTRSGISDLKRAYNVAEAFCKDICVIINKSNINLENRDAIRHLCVDLGIEVVAELEFDRRMVEAQCRCRTIVDDAPLSSCAIALKGAFERICR